MAWGNPLIRRNFSPSYHSNEKFLYCQVKIRNNETFSATTYVHIYSYVCRANCLTKGELQKNVETCAVPFDFPGRVLSWFEVFEAGKSPGVACFSFYFFLAASAFIWSAKYKKKKYQKTSRLWATLLISGLPITSKTETAEKVLSSWKWLSGSLAPLPPYLPPS